jgi:hypothetical protein
MHTPSLIIVFCASMLAACSDQDGDPEVEREVGRNVLVLSASGIPMSDPLHTMRWSDVAPTARAAHASGATEALVKVAAGCDEAPARYLVGLLELSRDRPERACVAWDGLDPFAIPGDYLYAPWRLAGEIDPKASNRYDEPLAEAVRQQAVAPLIRARFLSAQASWAAALEAYLRTDPASWSRHDLGFFRSLRTYSPAAQETKVLLAAALRGGRVPVPLREPISALIKGTGDDGQKEILREKLAARLSADPELARQALAAAARQLKLRVAFGEGRFEDVLNQSRSIDPVEATDETVLLTFLAAVQSDAHQLDEQWGRELRRRNPEERVKQWIEAVKKR